MSAASAGGKFARMNALFRFPTARRRDPEVERWFAQGDALRGLIEPWFERLRVCDPNVRDLIHDGRPTACVEDAAFAYVDAYAEHAAIGFYFGAALDDPAGLLEGAGKRKRHIKLRPHRMPDAAALNALVAAACRDMRRRLEEARS